MKIKTETLTNLKKIISRLKKNNKKIVFTNGCFDLIHPGHIKILTSAKKKGDVLIVGLNSDRSIKAIKGKNRPILNQKARVQILSAITPVDYLIIFDQKTPYQIIKKIKPTIIVKGQDWPKDKIIGREFANKLISVKLTAGYSTTKIIEKIKKSG